jgi:hypothetical protein
MKILTPKLLERNAKLFRRTVLLTQAAINKLESEGKRVTINSILEASRGLDVSGKGISCAATILGNSEAEELFHQHSPAYQKRQQQLKKVRRKRTSIKKENRETYKGLTSSDLIVLAEGLKQQIQELKEQIVTLNLKRDEAIIMRDEALRINRIQLIQLTTKNYKRKKKQ